MQPNSILEIVMLVFLLLLLFVSKYSEYCKVFLLECQIERNETESGDPAMAVSASRVTESRAHGRIGSP